MNRIGKSYDSYRIIRKIDEGGFGTVYLAEEISDKKDRKQWAIKFIDRKKKEHFERESKAVDVIQEISNKEAGILSILHKGQDDDSFYYIMPLVEGPRDITPDNENWLPHTLQTRIDLQLKQDYWFPIDVIVGTIGRIVATYLGVSTCFQGGGRSSLRRV